jgi:hypothetical protein
MSGDNSKQRSRSRAEPDSERTDESTGRATSEESHEIPVSDDEEPEDDRDRDPPGDSGNGGDGGDGDGGDGSIPPSDDEVRLLVFLWLLEQRDDTVTGVQAKAFYRREIAEGDNVGELYAGLKGEYIASRQDSEPISLTAAGRRVASDASAVQETVIDVVLDTVADLVPENETLERLFWLGNAAPASFDWYLDRYDDRLDDQMVLLVPFFTDERFQSRARYGAILDSLPDIPATVENNVAELVTDEEHLIGAAVAAGDTTVELLDAQVQETLRCDYRDALTIYLGEQATEQVIDDLAYAGLTRNRNAFDIDITGVLESERSRLQERFALDKDACRAAFEENWDLVLEWYGDFPGRSHDTIDLLVETGASIPSDEGFGIRTDVADIGGEVVDDLLADIEERIDRFSNVALQLAFDFDAAMNREEEIIITLHETSWSSNQHYYPALVKGTGRKDPDRNPLTEKVILVPSPTEFGFEDSHLDSDRYHSRGSALEGPNRNREFNAIGDVPELTAVKGEFSNLDWEQVDDSTVQAARELLEERSRISPEEALRQAEEFEEPHLTALYTIANKATTSTSIRNDDYTEHHVWDDVERTLQLRFDDLSADDIDEVREDLENHLVKQAGVDVVEFDDDDLLERVFGTRYRRAVKERIRGLATDAQRMVHVFLSDWGENSSIDIRNRRHQPEFDLRYQFEFGKAPPAEPQLSDVLVRAGVCTIGTYIDSSGAHQGERYVVYTGIRARPEAFRSELTVEPLERSVDRLDEYRQDISQLAGLEYLLGKDGGKTPRKNLRDHLLRLDDDAMRAFEFVDGIVAEKDGIVMLNPAISSDLDLWLIQAKRSLMDNLSDIEAHLQASDHADLHLEFNPEERIYEGELLTKEGDELQLIVAPWLTEDDEDQIDDDAVVILTQHAGEAFIGRRKTGYKRSLVIGIGEDGLQIYHDLPHDDIATPIIDSFTKEFEVQQQEVAVDTEHSESESQGEQESVQIDQQESEEAADTATTTSPESAVTSDTTGGESQPPATNLSAELFEFGEPSFPGDILRDRPVILLLHKPEGERFGTTLQFLCRELYHQYQGGLPRGRVHGNPEELGHRLEAGGRIEFVDESEGRFFDSGKISDSSVGSARWSSVIRRIQEMYTQGMGFVILQLRPQDVHEFRSKLEDDVLPHRPQIFELDPLRPKADFTSTKGYLEWFVPRAEALWGYPDLQGELYSYSALDSKVDNFDDIFTLAERRAWQRLEDATTEPIDDGTKQRSPAMVVRPHRSSDAGPAAESDLHYALKSFVARWLIESDSFDFESVATERETDIASRTGGTLIPDVQAGRTVYEVETLYGTGRPILSVKQTVEKYRNLGSPPESITIVLSPIAAFLHYQPLRRLEYEMNTEWDLEVDLTLPVLREDSLDELDRLRRSFEVGVGDS